MSEPKEIFIRNKERTITPQIPHGYEGYNPEHERLNRTPEYADPTLARVGKQQIAEDFQHAKRYPLIIGSSKGKMDEQRRIREEEAQLPPQYRRHMAVASGHNEEPSWIPHPIENHNSNPNNQEIKFDDISVPPPEIRFQVAANGPPQTDPRQAPPPPARAPDPYGHLPQQRHGNPPRVSIDDIVEGNYFVVVTDTIIAESPALDDIEDFVERMLYNSSNNVKLEDIVVLRKMKVKVGVGVS